MDRQIIDVKHVQWDHESGIEEDLKELLLDGWEIVGSPSFSGMPVFFACNVILVKYNKV